MIYCIAIQYVLMLAFPLSGGAGLIVPIVCTLVMKCVTDFIKVKGISNNLKSHQLGLAYLSIKIIVVVAVLSFITLSFSMSEKYTPSDKSSIDHIVFISALIATIYFYLIIIKNVINLKRNKEFKTSIGFPFTFRQWKKMREF